MWVLEDKNSDAVWSLPLGLFKIGRKGCDINVTGQGVSRLHATITITGSSDPPVTIEDENSLSSAIPSLEIEDVSKFGTYVDGTKMPKRGKTCLKAGEDITIGLGRVSKYRLHYSRLVVCSSQKVPNGVSALVRGLAGAFVSRYSANVTHVVMEPFALTLKALLCVARGGHIVSPEWAELQSKTITGPPLTKPYSSIPDSLVKDLGLSRQTIDSSLASDPTRASLLASETVVFLGGEIADNKVMECYVQLARAMGARVVETEYETPAGQLRALCDPTSDVVVMFSCEDEQGEKRAVDLCSQLATLRAPARVFWADDYTHIAAALLEKDVGRVKVCRAVVESQRTRKRHHIVVEDDQDEKSTETEDEEEIVAEPSTKRKRLDSPGHSECDQDKGEEPDPQTGEDPAGGIVSEEVEGAKKMDIKSGWLQRRGRTRTVEDKCVSKVVKASNLLRDPTSRSEDSGGARTRPERKRHQINFIRYTNLGAPERNKK